MQRSGLKYTIAFVVLAVVLFGIWYVVQRTHSPAADLARELAVAQKAGLPIRLQDLQAPLPPSDQNAAPLYMQFDALLKAKPLDKEKWDVDPLVERSTPTPTKIAKTRTVLAHHRDLLALIHRAAARPQCVFKRDWSKGWLIQYPEFSPLRTASRWITAESSLLFLDGKSLEAVHNQALGFRIARHAAGEPILIASIAANSINWITLVGLEHMLYYSDGNPVLAAAVQQTIEQEWKPVPLAYTFQGELPIWLDLHQRIRHDGIEGVRHMYLLEDSTVQAIRNKYGDSGERLNGWADANIASVASVLRQIIAAAERPYPDVVKQMQALAVSYEKTQNLNHAMVSVMIPAWVQCLTTQPRYQARAQVVRCGAAALAWKARHGALPTALSQAIAPVPADPFDSKPLRYKREGSGFVVYSVGETGHFDGGAPNVKPDGKETLFRYPMPPYWK